MDTYFYIVTISLVIALILRSICLKQKVSHRTFAFDYALEEKDVKFSWKSFVIPVLLVSLVVLSRLDVGFLILSILFLLATVYDMIKPVRAQHKSYLIRDTTLIYNGWRIKEFDLKELESIRFLPFRDSFKLIFKNSKSLIIPRFPFESDLLRKFIKRALQLTATKIQIEEDAKTKIYV